VVSIRTCTNGFDNEDLCILTRQCIYILPLTETKQAKFTHVAFTSSSLQWRHTVFPDVV